LRKNHSQDFILLCKNLTLFGDEEVAVCGSFKGDANTDSIFTAKPLDNPLATP